MTIHFVDEGENQRYDASMADAIAAATRVYGALTNVVTGEGTNADRSTFAAPNSPQILSREQLRGLVANSWVARNAVEDLPEYCVKQGIELFFKDDTLEGDIKAELDHYDVLDAFADAHAAARQFGGAALLVMVEDYEPRTEDNNLDHSRPLFDAETGEMTRIKEFKGLYKIEGGKDSYLRPASLPPPWAPEGTRLDDWNPGKNFAKPLWWEWNPQPGHPTAEEHEKPQGVIIHRDRLIFFPGALTDRETRIDCDGWDLSVLNAAIKAITNFDSSHSNLVNIIYDFFTTIIKVKDFKKIATSGEISALVERFEAMLIGKSTLNALMCDAVDEEVVKVASPVGGLEGLIDKLMDAAAGAVREPRSLLFREAPSSGGQDEAGRKFWIADIQSAQRKVYKPGLRRVIDILRKAEVRPAEEDALEIGFKPIEPPSEKERAEAVRTLAHADEINIKAGIYSRKEARGRHMGVGGVSELKLEGEEPPDESEFAIFQQAAQSIDPGRQRMAGENTEAEGKVPNAAATERTP